MVDQRIDPHRVTKPIQLLAAWLVGLCVVTGSFLGSAVALAKLPWLSGILVGAAILNVPLFLYALFLLQTKYRPEMQEDSYYATYLDKNTKREVEVVKPSLRDPRFDEVIKELNLIQNRVIHTLSAAKQVEVVKPSLRDPRFDEVIKVKYKLHERFAPDLERG